MRRLPCVRVAIVLLAGLCLLVVRPSRLLAQPGSGALLGDVLDAAGEPVDGAVVTVTSASTGAVRRTTSRGGGHYAVPALPPGVYRLEVASPGFRPSLRDGLVVTTGETIRADARLEVGGLAEALTIEASTPLVRADAGGLGHLVDQRKVTDLPLNGRSFVSLVALVPGVALPPGSQLPRINGGRPRVNEYLFDGVSVLQPEPGQVAYFPNVDAIQEFKVETNSPPAEFGRFNGGIINLTTKSGTNAVHGTAFGFGRHEALNARNPFAPAGPAPRFRRVQAGGVAGGPIVRDRAFFFADYQGQHQAIGRTVVSTVPTVLQRQGIFSEAIGGRVPVIYDPATTVTTGSGLTRAPFPGNVIPQARFDPVARALLARYPLPTSAGTASNYRRTGDERVEQHLVSLRLDQRVGAGRDQAFARLTRFSERFVPVTPLPEGSGVSSGTPGPQDTTSWALATSWQRVFSDRLLHEVRVGDTRRAVTRTAAQLPTTASLALGLPGIPATAQFPTTLPTVQVAGYQQLGSPANTATDFATSVTQLADALTWLAGRHTIKAGADLRWERLDVVQPPSPTGAFTFSSLFTDLPGVANTGTPFASFLLGQVQQFSIDVQPQQIRNRASIQEYFVQDDWRVADRLTLHAGLRYTLNFPSTEENDQVAVFNLQTQQLEYAGRDGRPRAARQLHRDNVGPRVSLTARPSDATVLRAGYGLVWIEMAGVTSPFTTPVFPFLQSVSQRTLDGVTPAFVLAGGPSVEPIPLTPDAGLGQGVFAVDRDLGSGYVQQWHAGAQRQIGRALAVEAAYTGSTIIRVGLPDSNLNQLSVEQLALGAALLQRVPNPYFGQIPRSSSLGDPTIPLAQLLRPYPRFTTVSLYRNNVGTTSYHGAYVKVERRVATGLSYLVSYTRSRLVDDASSVFDASILTGPVANFPVADSFDRGRERDYSTGDIPHAFVASAVWDLPYGRGRARAPRGWLGAVVNDWTLTGVLTLQSGTPVAVTQATNLNAFAGFGTQRPNLVGDPQLPRAERTTDRWFDTSAFAVAPQFTLGSASRNPVRGPGWRNLDLALIRRVPLGGAVALELRAEVFNAANTPALGAPNGVFGSAAFGAITSAGDPRVVQLGAKVAF